MIVAICFGVMILIWIIYEIIIAYHNKKIKEVLDFFREESRMFNKMAEGSFEEETNGRKISKWNKEHAIDYIINRNIEELSEELKKYDQLKDWWRTEMPKIKEQSYSKVILCANNMLLFGGLYKNRAEKKLNELIEKYNPNNITFKLCTYTFYEEGVPHYNPNIQEMTTTGSTHKSITFFEELSPDKLRERIKILSQYNFSVTEYQYNCNDQRKIMSKELRERVIDRDKSICQICGKHCLPTEIEIDHIQPISKGGKTVIQNLQVLCRKCNRAKSNKWEEEFLWVTNNHTESVKSDFSHSFNNNIVINNVNHTSLSEKFVEIDDVIKILFLEDNEEETYQIVENMSNKNNSKFLTSQSAVGKAILGHKEGDVVQVCIDNKSFKVKILEIEKKKQLR